MDQSTQVNFPTALPLPKPRLQRLELGKFQKKPPWATHTSLPSVLPHLKLATRPKSLHLPNEGLRNPLDYPTELMLRVVSTDGTPPFTPNYKHNNSRYHTPMSEYTSSSSGCKCFYDTTNSIKGQVPTPTPEGLSWRRLHMSRAKLKATSTTSELLSGFAMVAMVELQINEDTTVPEWLFVIFSVCTTVLVAVHIFALMISTYILPNIDAISKLDVCELVTESPHERMKGFIELAWAFSTVLGLFLFLVEVAILCWVKFWDYSFTAAIAATVIVIPVLIMFVLFAVHFYHSLVVHRCDTSITDMQKLEDMKRQLDEVRSPV